MPNLKVFYSWQSDTPRKIGSDFVRRALTDACERLSAEAQLGARISVDSDTQGEPGTPPINETILRKIKECDLFVGDVTFVAESAAGKKVPNPNVMAEYGYALSERGHRRIRMVMNTTFGPPEALPFDLHHLRHPAQFEVSEDQSDAVRRAARTQLSELLERDLAAMIKGVLDEKKPAPPSTEIAEARIADLQNQSFHAPVPIPSPKLVIHVAPQDRLKAPPLQRVEQIRSYFMMPGFEHKKDDVSASEWWSFDPPRRLGAEPNPTSRWCIRLFRDGAMELMCEIGRRVDNDSEIPVNGWALEALIEQGLIQLSAIHTQLWSGASVLIRVALAGVEDVILQRSRPGGRKIRHQYVELGSFVASPFEPTFDDEIIPILDAMWLSSGWSDGSGRTPGGAGE